MEDLKIRQKTEDMIKYGYICLRQFPKSEKHTLAAQVKICLLIRSQVMLRVWDPAVLKWKLKKERVNPS